MEKQAKVTKTTNATAVAVAVAAKTLNAVNIPMKCSYDFLDKIEYCDSVHKYVDTLRSQAFKSTRC